MTSPSRLDEVRRVLDATPPTSSALPALRDPAPLLPVQPALRPDPVADSAEPPAVPMAIAAPLAHPVGWASGVLAVAGIIHLTLLPHHLESARGIGLYFCAVGAAQVVYALLFVLRPTRRLAWLGLMALVAQPFALYVLTRLLRQPFGDEPEPVDLIGIVTAVMELAAVVAFAFFLARSRPAGATPGRAIGLPLASSLVVGLLFGVALYGAGLVAEELVPWLDEPEEPHTHGHADPTAGGLAEAAAATQDAGGHDHSHG